MSTVTYVYIRLERVHGYSTTRFCGSISTTTSRTPSLVSDVALDDTPCIARFPFFDETDGDACPPSVRKHTSNGVVRLSFKFDHDVVNLYPLCRHYNHWLSYEMGFL